MPRHEDLESELRAILKIADDEPLGIDSNFSSRSNQKKKCGKETTRKLTHQPRSTAESKITVEVEDSQGISVDFGEIKQKKKANNNRSGMRAINALCRKSQSQNSSTLQKPASSDNIDALKPNLFNLDAERELKRMISGNGRTLSLKKSLSVSERRNPFFTLWNHRTYSTTQSYVGEFCTSSTVNDTSCQTVIRLTHGPHYNTVKIQAQMFAGVADLGGLQHLLARFPCHLDALFYTFNLLNLAGESNDAREILEHAMYCIGEVRSGFRFSWTDTYTTRILPFHDASNQVVHLVMSAYSHALLRQDCTITAFEVLRMQWNLDPRDPMHVLFNIEYCGLENRYYRELLDILDALPSAYQVLPNIMYTKAICLFSEENLHQTGKPHSNSSNALRVALQMFPSIARCLYQYEWKKIVPSNTPTIAEHAFLEKLSKVYAARNGARWKKPGVIEWMKEVAKTVDWTDEKVKKSSRNAKMALLSSQVVNYYQNISENEILGKMTSAPMEVIADENQSAHDSFIMEPI